MPKPLITIIVIVIIALTGFGTWWFVTSQPAQQSTTSENSTTTPETSQTTPTTDTSAGITIVFTSNGFEKQNYSVAKGQTVAVKNNSNIVVEFSSDEHPTHTDNPELNMDVLQPGQQGTFTPERTGTWGIHDHEHPEFTTTLTVTE